MSTSIYADFKKWYDEYSNSDVIFNFEKEIKEYCIQDVKYYKGVASTWGNYLLKKKFPPAETEAM